jgi:hypothetical protein
MFVSTRPRRRRVQTASVAIAQVQVLESRVLPVSVSVSSGVLTLTGDGSNDVIYVSGTTQVGYTYEWSDGGLGGTDSAVFASNAIKKVVIRGGGGNDRIEVKGTRLPVEIYGDDGVDTIYAEAGYHTVNGGLKDDKITVLVDVDNVLDGRRNFFSTSSFASGNGIDTVTVKLDKESFARRYMNVIFDQIDRAVNVLSPVIDRLNTKIPVLGKLDSSLTFAKVISMSSSSNSSLKAFLNAFEVLDSWSNIEWTGTTTLGTFKIASGKSSISSAISTVSSGGLGVFDSARLKSLTALGVTFPAFSSPTKFVQTLFGVTTTLVEYTLPKLSASSSYSNSWYVPTGVAGVSVKVSIKGTVTGTAGMTVGFDSSGFKTGKLTDGFYLKNVTASLGAKMSGSGSLTAGIPSVWDAVEAGAKATITGTLHFTVKDPNRDGKIRLGEMADTARGSVSASGSIGYSLAGYVAYEVLEFLPWPTWVSYEHDWEFARGTLWST